MLWNYKVAAYCQELSTKHLFVGWIELYMLVRLVTQDGEEQVGSPISLLPRGSAILGGLATCKGEGAEGGGRCNWVWVSDTRGVGTQGVDYIRWSYIPGRVGVPGGWVPGSTSCSCANVNILFYVLRSLHRGWFLTNSKPDILNPWFYK